jgi:hypothetical protein
MWGYCESLLCIIYVGWSRYSEIVAKVIIGTYETNIKTHKKHKYQSLYIKKYKSINRFYIKCIKA